MKVTQANMVQYMGILTELRGLLLRTKLRFDHVPQATNMQYEALYGTSGGGIFRGGSSFGSAGGMFGGSGYGSKSSFIFCKQCFAIKRISTNFLMVTGLFCRCRNSDFCAMHLDDSVAAMMDVISQNYRPSTMAPRQPTEVD